VLAVAAGFGLYYAVPDAWLKVVVGVAAGALLYLALVAARAPSRKFEATTESQRAS
jgi:threonine/homoserine/homoserine lactone efflux protein